ARQRRQQQGAPIRSVPHDSRAARLTKIEKERASPGAELSRVAGVDGLGLDTQNGDSRQQGQMAVRVDVADRDAVLRADAGRLSVIRERRQHDPTDSEANPEHDDYRRAAV